MPNSDKLINERFLTTQWSMVAQAGNQTDNRSVKALQELCQNYWLPLYAYARRRMDPEKAEDMTQGFFAVLLEKNFLETAKQGKGRFRAFLITAFKHFLLNQHDYEQAIKRGGQTKLLSLDFDSANSQISFQPVDNVTPEKVFERQWVLTLLKNVMERLRIHYAGKGGDHLTRFETLTPQICGEPTADYLTLSKQLGVSPEALRVEVHRIRKKYRQTLREEIASTVSGPDEVDDEIQRLFDVMA